MENFASISSFRNFISGSSGFMISLRTSNKSSDCSSTSQRYRLRSFSQTRNHLLSFQITSNVGNVFFAYEWCACLTAKNSVLVLNKSAVYSFPIFFVLAIYSQPLIGEAYCQITVQTLLERRY